MGEEPNEKCTDDTAFCFPCEASGETFKLMGAQILACAKCFDDHSFPKLQLEHNI
jgi:hypothetical protein